MEVGEFRNPPNAIDKKFTQQNFNQWNQGIDGGPVNCPCSSLDSFSNDKAGKSSKRSYAGSLLRKEKDFVKIDKWKIPHRFTGVGSHLSYKNGIWPYLSRYCLSSQCERKQFWCPITKKEIVKLTARLLFRIPGWRGNIPNCMTFKFACNSCSLFFFPHFISSEPGRIGSPYHEYGTPRMIESVEGSCFGV